MSIQSEINRISGAKSDIADAIEDQGVTVPSGTKLDGMANLIGQIPAGGSDKLNSTQAADAYDPTATYAVGDKVSYAGNVYSCISAISTPEAWDSTHWDQVDPIQDQVDDVKNTLNDKAAKVDLTDINQTSPTCTVQNGISKGTFFYLDGNLVKAISDIGNGASFNSGVNYRVISDGLANEMSTDDWHYLTTTSTHYSMPNTQYQTNAYVIRSGMCFLTISLDVVSPVTSSEALCNVPSLAGVNTLLLPVGDTYETGSAPVRLLIQGGILYARGGTANTGSGTSICYPCDL